MSILKNLEPRELWSNFELLNAVPRPSKKEERVIAFIKAFGESLNLPTKVDAVGNVLITKPASKGMENAQTVVLQSHLDMVHQKNNHSSFDFDSEGIKMKIDGDWVKADETTLGADNGIGVASIMAILASNEIQHPAIEALFTIDEETGMTGAFGLQPHFLKGTILLNLDTEDDDELTIGCAGGVNVTGSAKYQEISIPSDYKTFQITLNGLSGGHSGMDIIKGLGNANKLMNRFLQTLNAELNMLICSIKGGGLRNAIPRESIAVIAVSPNEVARLNEMTSSFLAILKSEHEITDPNVNLILSPVEAAYSAASKEFATKALNCIYAIPDGIYRMSSAVAGMVQTSNNLAQVNMVNGNLECLCLCRSSVDSEKLDEVAAIKAALSIVDAKVAVDGDYPGWTPKAKSNIVNLMSTLYQDLFNEKPHVMACHAGLECGIIGSNYQDMDMVSFGPNIRGAHSPDEKVQISSVQKYWNFLLETLKRIPAKS